MEIPAAASPSSESHEEQQKIENSDGATTTVYVFLFHERGSLSHSFYAIDIPNPPYPPPRLPSFTYNASERKFEKIPFAPPIIREPLSPIFEFDAEIYPRRMLCAKFCSKFFFLGGQNVNANGKEASVHVLFPPNVYIYDPISQLLKTGVPMSTGKPNAVFFAVDHKLYVLGSRAHHYKFSMSDHPIPMSRTAELDSGINHFEVFDISTGGWTVLEDPPMPNDSNHPFIWSNCTVVKRKVLVLGSTGKAYLQLAFDLDAQEWTKLSPPPLCYCGNHFIPSPELVGGDTFYGMTRFKLGKLGPFNTEDELAQYEDKLFTGCSPKQVSLDVVDNELFSESSGLDCSNTMCHLGDRLFCYVKIGLGIRKCCENPREYGEYWADEHTLLIAIKLLKEEFQQEEEPSCISTTPTESNKDSSFNAKYVYSADYVVKTSFDSTGFIDGCYPLCPKEKKKLKKKINKKSKELCEVEI